MESQNQPLGDFEKRKKSASGLKAFMDVSPTAFHVTANLRKALLQKGYIELSEQTTWKIEEGKGYFVSRNDSALIAFVLPPKVQKFLCVSTHTDSPLLKLKNLQGVLKGSKKIYNVEAYGAPILSTWVDRGLSVAGRVFVYDPTTHKPVSRLVNFEKEMAWVSNPPIHLARDINQKGMIYEMQKNLKVFGEWEEETFEQTLLNKLEIEKKELLSFELFFYDPSALSVLPSGIILSGRLDNQSMCYAALEALLDTPFHEMQEGVIAGFFDNEEIGSLTYQGAQSNFFLSSIEEILGSLGRREEKGPMMARSFLLSLDVAHAFHPLYEDKFDAQHALSLGGGIVMKSHGGQSYASNAFSRAYVEASLRENGLRSQGYRNHSDLPSGKTVGPILSSQGMRAIDLGIALNAMHSIREAASMEDIEEMKKLLGAFYRAQGVWRN